MTVSHGDSGAPLFWQGQVFQWVEQVPDPKQVKKRGAGMQEEHLFVAVPQDDLKLIGVHCGSGVYVKVAVLAKGFASWPKMETLQSVGYAHPHVDSPSKHTTLKPTTLDKLLFDRVGPSNNECMLIEKRVGRFWMFSFNESGALITVATADSVFHRTDSEAVGGSIEQECLRFVGAKTTKGTFDAVFLFRVYPNPRSDGVVLSGVICADLEPGESYVSSQCGIAWIWKNENL